MNDIRAEDTRLKIFPLFVVCAAASVLFPSSLRILGVQLFDLLAYGTVALAFLSRVIGGRGSYASAWRRVMVACLAFLAVAVVSLLANVGHSGVGGGTIAGGLLLFGKASGYGLATALLLFATFYAVGSNRVSEGDRARLMSAIVLSGGISAIVTLYTWVATTGGVLGRYNFVPPITESQGLHLYYMALTVLLTLALLRSSYYSSLAMRAALWASAGLAVASIATVMVREGWLIFATSLFLAMRLSAGPGARRSNVLLLWAMGSVILSGVLFVLLGSGMLDDILSGAGGERGDSALVRILMIQNALGVFMDNAIIGVGYGNFALHAAFSIELSGGEAVEVASPHNALIMFAVETGIVGVCCMILLSVRLVQMLRGSLRSGFRRVQLCLSAVLYPLILLLVLDQLISNSLIVPPPAERRVVQLSFLLWLLIAACAQEPRPIADLGRATERSGAD